MSKKSLLKIFLLTPLAGLVLAGSAFLINDYPQSIASFISTGIHENDSQKNPAQTPSIDKTQLRQLVAEEIQNQLLASRPAALTSSTALHMLETTVKVERLGGGSGSGVPVFENQIGEQFYTYIITNAHVVSDEEEVRISRFHYKNHARVESTTVYPGRVILVEPAFDLALVELQTNESIGQMASFISTSLSQELALTQQIFVSSCPLGSPPLVTSGRVASIEDTLTVITAFSIFGSSGSGAYNIDGNLVGIVKAIVRVRLDKNHVIPEPNLTHIVPLPVVISWLLVKDHGFIVGEGTSHEDFILARSLSEIRPR